MALLTRSISTLVLFLLLSVCYGQAQPNVLNPSVNDYTASTGVANSTSLTISNVVTSGSNRCLAVCVFKSYTTDVSSVAFNTSENASFVAEAQNGDDETEFWFLVAPTATTADVDITLTGAGGSGAIMAHAIAIEDCNQAQPTLNNNEMCTGCTSESVNLTTTEDNTLLLTCARHTSHVGDWSHGTGQTELSDFVESAGGGHKMSTSEEVKATAGLETLTSTSSNSGNIEMLAIGVEPVAAPPSGRRRVSPFVVR